MTTIDSLCKDVCRIIAEYVQNEVIVTLEVEKLDYKERRYIKVFETVLIPGSNVCMDYLDRSNINPSMVIDADHDGFPMSYEMFKTNAKSKHKNAFFHNGYELFFHGHERFVYYIEPFSGLTSLTFKPKPWSSEVKELMDIMAPPIPRIKNQT